MTKHPRAIVRATTPVYLTDRQVADRYGISRQTVWAWIKRESLPSPIRLTAGCVRWSVDDLERWEESRREVS